MNKITYKEKRISELGDAYKKYSTSKTEWDIIISMECGENPKKRENTSGTVALNMLLDCRFTPNEIDARCAQLFPEKKNIGRAKRMANIFTKGKCRNVEIYKFNGKLGLKWNRYKFFDETGAWQGEK